MPFISYEINVSIIRGGVHAKGAQSAMSEERPAQQHRSGEGTLITVEEIEQFLALYESLDRAEGTIKFYRRKLTQFYEDLPVDKRSSGPISRFC